MRETGRIVLGEVLGTVCRVNDIAFNENSPPPGLDGVCVCVCVCVCV